jgi:cell division protein FtsB
VTADRFRELRDRFSRAALQTEAQRPLLDAGIELCTELAALWNEHLGLRRENDRLRQERDALERFVDVMEKQRDD